MQEANVIYSNECDPRKWSRKRKAPNGAVGVVGRCKVRWHGIPWKFISGYFSGATILLRMSLLPEVPGIEIQLDMCFEATTLYAARLWFVNRVAT